MRIEKWKTETGELLIKARETNLWGTRVEMNRRDGQVCVYHGENMVAIFRTHDVKVGPSVNVYEGSITTVYTIDEEESEGDE
jgi:hypothetical protein